MNRRTTLAAALALTASFALAGCGNDDAPELKVSGAYMPAPVSQGMAAGFLDIKNSGAAADKLTSVTSDISDEVTIHETVGNKMQEVKSLDVPANGELKLASGGNHLMFMKLKEKPAEGGKVSIELRFEKSGPIKVELPVKAATYSPKGGGKDAKGGMDHGAQGGMDHGAKGGADHGMQHGADHDAKK